MSESARRRILVVDDEQDVIDILQEHLATTYDVTPARDGKRAAEVLKHGAFSYFPKPFDFRYLDHLAAVALSR